MQATLSKGIVYVATCKINGKKYVGQTTKSLSERIEQHRRASNSKTASYSLFIQAIREYSIENFDWEIYCECKCEELPKKEIEVIRKLKTAFNGYNLTFGGIGRLGYKHSEETKEKMREKALNMTLEHRRKIGEASKGRSPSAETRRKISNTLKGNTNAEGHRLTEEQKQRIVKDRIGKPLSSEHKEKLSKVFKGRVFTEEWKDKLGKAVTINGITYPTHVKAAEAMGLKYNTFRARLRRGYYDGQIS